MTAHAGTESRWRSRRRLNSRRARSNRDLAAAIEIPSFPATSSIDNSCRSRISSTPSGQWRPWFGPAPPMEQLSWATTTEGVAFSANCAAVSFCGGGGLSGDGRPATGLRYCGLDRRLFGLLLQLREAYDGDNRKKDHGTDDDCDLAGVVLRLLDRSNGNRPGDCVLILRFPAYLGPVLLFIRALPLFLENALLLVFRESVTHTSPSYGLYSIALFGRR